MKLTSFLRLLRKAVGFSRCVVLIALGLSVGRADGTAPAKSTSTAAHSTSSSTAKTDDKDMKEITPVLAEKPASPFTVRVGAPLWVSAISGSVGVRGRVSDAAYINFTDIFNHLDYSIPGSIEVGYGKWGILLDGQYTKLSDTLDTRDIIFNNAAVQIEQAFADFNISYKVVDEDNFSLAPFIGTRFEYVRISGQASTTGRVLGTPLSFDESKEKAWADPILGVQLRYHITKPFCFIAKADVGGFGAASHLTYQAFGGFETQVTRWFYINGGYRYLQTNYSSNGFTWNIAYSGPQITCGFNF